MGLYRAIANNLIASSTPNDIITIVGNSSKLTKVLAIELVTLQTTAGLNTWYVIKRSSLNTYSTAPTVMTPIAYDSFDTAPLSTVAFATVNPTAMGASIGPMAVASILAPAASSLVSDAVYVFDFNKNPIMLRSAVEVLTLTFGGAAKPAGFTMSVAVIFAEET